MPITQVRCSKKRNLGNYESSEIGCVYDLDSSESPEQALAKCQRFCETGQLDDPQTRNGYFRPTSEVMVHGK